jgi:hypothetical protein
MKTPNSEWQNLLAECERIMKLSAKEIMAEHLRLYNGDKKLAQKSLDMLRAQLETDLSKHWKQ